MLFNSIEFAIFLPIVFILYWLLSSHNRLQNLFILIASYVFYGFWDFRFLILIAFTSFLSWMSGLLIHKYRHNPSISKAINISNITINLLILCIFKYYNFFISSLGLLFPSIHADNLLIDVILPVGISFYTFQALSYSIDVYRGQIEPTRDIIAFFAYVSFFPQLVAGPIERAANLLPQFEKNRLFDYNFSVQGLRLILWGLFKKIVVADNCAIYVDYVWNNYTSMSGSTLFVAALFFAFQIYGDFSGYSDIARGTARLFGFRLMKNFDLPYFSLNIKEFWKKWHISLTSWFRDYLYIPLGGNRVPKIKIARNTIIVFGVSGLWHGAEWTFILWGLYHGFLFLPSIFRSKIKPKNTHDVPLIVLLSKSCFTFILVTLGWIIFRSSNTQELLTIISAIFSKSFFSIPLFSKYIIFIIIMLCIEWTNTPARKKLFRNVYVRYCLYFSIATCVVFYFLAHIDYPSNFIYFQF